MGRYYTGDIVGKFWFAIQSSDDASHFGASPEQFYEYYGCHCKADVNEGVNEDVNEHYIYCKQCYTSLDDHLEQTKDERVYDESRTFYQEGELSYDFGPENLPVIQQKIKELEEKVGTFMKGYKIVDKEGEISYDFTILPTSKPTQQELVEIARLCLGYQIQYCVEKYDRCFFQAEI
jgi:hypothetical protein